ncbi:ribosome hibernation-promoting factor, HPF/YfiA family [Radicibacter daui]|uniref:ribosome hibernation-promoting factor, HPF/YfiA family n=1 Tax=Radicibacter daui TaxID=3064829 RepID=UPI004046B6CB
MQLTIRGKQIDVGDALRTHVSGALTEVANKYFNDPIEANVVFSREGHMFKCDVVIHVGKRILLQANAEANEPYPSFDGAAEKIGKRLRRYKRRLRDHHLNGADGVSPTTAQYNVIESRDDLDDEAGEHADGAPVIIADMTTQVETLAVSDAVMRLDLGNLSALMFRNPAHGGLNMIYRRPDGNIGWVDPAVAGKSH